MNICLWTVRPVMPLFIILATLSCFLHCSESPVPVVGKMYPRGNHWAVGHLMGKKSIDSFAALQHTDSDYLRDARTEESTQLRRYARLVQRKAPAQMTAPSAHRLALLRSRWRQEDRDKYLREMIDLLLLALELQENEFV